MRAAARARARGARDRQAASASTRRVPPWHRPIPSRIVITVLGKNRAGIVAAISKILGEANVDIRDITQSIIEDIFTMTMLADMSESPMDFTALQEALAAGGEAVGVTVTIQREDVFDLMYRL